MTARPIRKLFDSALEDFRKALVKRGVYDENHQNLRRAYNGAKHFINLLIDGPKALRPRPPRS